MGGGKEIDVMVNGRKVTTFQTLKTGLHAWEWTTTYIRNLGLRVERGDELTITAHYENRSGFEIPGAMGIVGFYVAGEQ